MSQSLSSNAFLDSQDLSHLNLLIGGGPSYFH